MCPGDIGEDAEEKPAAKREAQDVVELCEKWRHTHQLKRGKDE